MIWLGSKDSSVSCSATHAYSVRTERYSPPAAAAAADDDDEPEFSPTAAGAAAADPEVVGSPESGEDSAGDKGNSVVNHSGYGVQKCGRAHN